MNLIYLKSYMIFKKYFFYPYNLNFLPSLQYAKFLSFACTPPVRLRGPPEAERIRRRITHTHKIIQPPRTWTIHTQRTVSQLRGLSSGGCQPSLFLRALTKILRRPPLFLLIAPLGDIASLSQSFFWQSESVHTYIPKV